MKEADAYLDRQEIKKLAVDLDNFSYMNMTLIWI